MSRLYVEIREGKEVRKTCLSPNIVSLNEFEEAFYDVLVLMGFSPKYKPLVITDPEETGEEE